MEGMNTIAYSNELLEEVKNRYNTKVIDEILNINLKIFQETMESNISALNLAAVDEVRKIIGNHAQWSETANFSFDNYENKLHFELFEDLRDLECETLRILLLDENKNVILSKDYKSNSEVMIRFNLYALMEEISHHPETRHFMMGHNHPNGAACLSNKDEISMKRVWHLLKLFGIEFEDSLVLTKNETVSVRALEKLIDNPMVKILDYSLNDIFLNRMAIMYGFDTMFFVENKIKIVDDYFQSLTQSAITSYYYLKEDVHREEMKKFLLQSYLACLEVDKDKQNNKEENK